MTTPSARIARRERDRGRAAGRIRSAGEFLHAQASIRNVGCLITLVHRLVLSGHHRGGRCRSASAIIRHAGRETIGVPAASLGRRKQSLVVLAALNGGGDGGSTSTALVVAAAFDVVAAVTINAAGPAVEALMP
jgi:hypothetical protein